MDGSVDNPRRKIRPLVEYFGGGELSPGGSFSSEDSSFNYDNNQCFSYRLPTDVDRCVSTLALGSIEPRWVEDKHRVVCSNCEMKFTLISRRHHCRACGEVFCAKCSNYKRVLPFNTALGFQRICKSCNDILSIISEEKRLKKQQSSQQASTSQRGSNNRPSSCASEALSDHNASFPAPHYSSADNVRGSRESVSHKDPSQYCSKTLPSSDAIMPTDVNCRPNNWIVYIPPELINNGNGSSDGGITTTNINITTMPANPHAYTHMNYQLNPNLQCQQFNAASSVYQVHHYLSGATTQHHDGANQRCYLKPALKSSNVGVSCEKAGCSSGDGLSTSIKREVCFADGIVPGCSLIEDPPTSKYDIIRKNAVRGRMQQQQQLRQQGILANRISVLHRQEDLDCAAGRKEAEGNFNPLSNNSFKCEDDDLEIVEVKPGAKVKLKLRETNCGIVYQSSSSTKSIKVNKTESDNDTDSQLIVKGTSEDLVSSNSGEKDDSIVLPPIVSSDNFSLSSQTTENSNEVFDEKNIVHHLLKNDVDTMQSDTVSFKLAPNFHVNVKVCNLSCCMNGDCFVFLSNGLEHHCQTEVMIIVRASDYHHPTDNEQVNEIGTKDKNPDIEKCVKQHRSLYSNKQTLILLTKIFDVYSYIYRMALMGITFKSLEFFSTDCIPSLSSSVDWSGVLFFTQTYQCELNLPLSPDKETRSPLLYATLLHKWESSWAKVYPLRVLLRLGHEFKQYPWPLVSVLNRDPLYVDVSSSLLDQFVDIQSFRFNDFAILSDCCANIISPPAEPAPAKKINSLANHQNEELTTEEGEGEENRKYSTTFLIPKNRHNLICEVLSSREEEEDEIIFGLSFSTMADSHLVCVEKDDGVFEPQAICNNTCKNGERKCTGVGFILFSANLHPDLMLLGDMLDVADSDAADSTSTNSNIHSLNSNSTTTTEPVTARITIVEDGLMVLMCKSLFIKLKEECFYQMKDFQVPCQPIKDFFDGIEANQSLSIRWIEDFEVYSPSEISPIDGMDLETKISCNVFNYFDYVCYPASHAPFSHPSLVRSTSDNLGDAAGNENSSLTENEENFKNVSGILRWTKLFYLNDSATSNNSQDGDDQEAFIDEPNNNSDQLPHKIAKAFCIAMSNHIKELKANKCEKIGLRVQITPASIDNSRDLSYCNVSTTEYKAGSNGTQFTNANSADSDDASSSHHITITQSMDTYLVPIVFEEATRRQSPIGLELHFYLLDIPLEALDSLS